MNNCEKCGYYSDGECNICGMGISGEDTFCRLCKDNPNCYYKQLSELKAENERLKEEVETRDNLVEHFRKEAINWAKIVNDCIKDIENYKQTLQEIKTIAEKEIYMKQNSSMDRILDLITKAEEE